MTDEPCTLTSNLRNDLEALDKRYLRLLDDYQKVVIANVEVAKVNVEQAETIERLRAEILDARRGGRLPEAFWLADETEPNT